MRREATERNKTRTELTEVLDTMTSALQVVVVHQNSVPSLVSSNCNFVVIVVSNKKETLKK